MTRKRFSWRSTADYGLIVTGAACNAVAIDLFLVPNHIVAGGVTGLAVIGKLTAGLPFSVGLLLLNIPLLVLQWKLLGGFRVFMRTVVGVGALAVLTDALQPFLPPVTADRLLVIAYGGALSGFGLALVFHGRGTTGGADILARLCHRYFGWRYGQTMLAVNVLVYGLAALLYGPEPAMVALLIAFVSARTMDSILHGMSGSRAVLIVTEQAEEVGAAVTRLLGRGLTVLPGVGGYTGRRKSMLYAVIPRTDVKRLKYRVQDVDPEAFLTIMTPQEAVGGYQNHRSG